MMRLKEFGTMAVIFWFYLFFIPSIIVGGIKTSKTPIILELKRILPNTQHQNNGTTPQTTFKTARSKPLLFQQVLGLVPGEDFDFNVDKWRALQSSGLYSNLTARTTIQPSDGGVALVITGYEGASLKFAPEISVGGSLADPEVSGGLIFIDRNFRGLGDSFEILLMKKEGAEESISQLGANWKLSWKDCAIGKDSRSSFEIEHENSIDLHANYLPSPSFILPAEIEKQQQFHLWKGAVSQNRIKLSCLKEIERSHEHMINWIFEPFHHVIHLPTIPEIQQQPIRTSGARFKLNHIYATENGMKSSIWYETGCTTFPIPNYPSKLPFHHVGVDFILPSYKMEIQPFWRKLPFISSSSLQWQKPLQFLHKFRITAIKSFGRGQIPSYHGRSLHNSQLVRGFPSNLANSYNSVSSLFNFKWDMYLENFPLGKLGFFSDSAIYHEKDDPQQQKQMKKVRLASTIGSSYSYQGVRVDIGVPINSLNTPRFYFGLDIEQ